MTDLEVYWKDLNHPTPGCSRCGKEINTDDGSKVTWRCNVCGHLVCRACTLTLSGSRTPPVSSASWPRCSWAIVGVRLKPVSDRAREFWIENHSDRTLYGRVNSINKDLIHVVMYDEEAGKAVGSCNLWKTGFGGEGPLDWNESDWEPIPASDTWSTGPSPGGREYYEATLCSVACWEAAGKPSE